MRERLTRLLRGVMPVLLAAGVVFAGRMWCEPIRVQGDSMAPALRSGDIALVRRGRTYERGDIVLVREPGREAYLHRVVRASRGGTAVTKGDANPTPDATAVDPGWVSGVMIASVPVGGLLSRWRSGGGRDTLSAQSDTARR